MREFVTRVIDGDTFATSSGRSNVRLEGVNAPELNEIGGPAAKGELHRLIHNRYVNIRVTGYSFNRRVAQVTKDGGYSVNQHMNRWLSSQRYALSSQRYV